MAAMPEANATAFPASSPPTSSSSASHVGVPSSREYSRPLPMMKFDAGISGTFNGAPGSLARPADTSHDSGLMLFERLSNWRFLAPRGFTELYATLFRRPTREEDPTV